MCVSILSSRSFSSVLADWNSRLILPILPSWPGLTMIIASFHISDICPIKIEDVSEIIDGTMSGLLEVEGAHPVWSDVCGQFGLPDEIFCVARRE